MLFFSNNSDGYNKKKRMRERIRIIVSVLVIALLAAGIVIYYEFTRESVSTEAILEPTPTIAVTAADLTETTAVSASNPDALQTPVPTFEPDLLKTVRNSDGIKTAYLTFDDGPTNSVTPKILDVLRRYNVKATFFQVGALIESNPDMARRVYEEGHLLANHSYAHKYSALYATQESFISEIQKTEELIKNITCEDEVFRLFRYPGGSYDAGTWGANKQVYKKVLADMNYYYCDWNALNGDAEGGERTAAQLVERVKSTTEGKEDVVILMHDAAAKKVTAESLAEVIEYLMAQGYEFKRLDE